jgi:hypothetical protein
MPLLNIIFASSGISEATKSSSFPWSGSLFFFRRSPLAALAQSKNFGFAELTCTRHKKELDSFCSALVFS